MGCKYLNRSDKIKTLAVPVTQARIVFVFRTVYVIACFRTTKAGDKYSDHYYRCFRKSYIFYLFFFCCQYLYLYSEFFLIFLFSFPSTESTPVRTSSHSFPHSLNLANSHSDKHTQLHSHSLTLIQKFNSPLIISSHFNFKFFNIRMTSYQNITLGIIF